MANLILVSPIDGWSSPLEEVPDPVFSGKVMGDGVAVDPTSATLRAPCDGEVITIAAAKHAIVMRAANGAQILLHVGCNTVEMNGEGFDVHVSAGQTVRMGQPLVTFDLDAIAQRVPSMLTPILLVDETHFAITRSEQGRAVRAGDFLMEIRSTDENASRTAGAGAEVRKQLRVEFEHGIHARPAALLAASLRGFSADVRAIAHGKTANARSAVAWMELGVRRGDDITLTANGNDAEAALAAIEAALPATAVRPVAIPQPPVATRRSDEAGVVRGVIASGGMAVGPAAHIGGAAAAPVENGAGVAHEMSELDRARGVVRRDLEQLHANAHGVGREVLEAHLSFVDDPELLETARASIARGRSAGFAWREAVEESVARLLAVGDRRVAERAEDLREVGGLVLRSLAGEISSLDVPAGSIVIGQALLVSQLAALPAGRIAGLCTAAGGPTSHVALLAASMNIPALVAAGPEVLRIADGTPLIVDAEAGVLHIAPDRATLAAAEQTVARRRADRETAEADAHEPCTLASGERIEAFANIAAADEVAIAIEHGAEGCGLLRTEFLFLDRDNAPDAGQQTDAYQKIVTAFRGRPVIIRTLDAGSDKPLPYLALPAGDNPALGVRGIRASLMQPELLRDQLRAILRVEPLSACRIMLPMITDLSEVASVRDMLAELCADARCAPPPVGVMIETPAAALIADRLARVAEFLSIGTNDLAQYTLAMDRGQAELAAQLDAMHPAVLRLIRATAEAGRAAGRTVAVCGGLASDPLAAPLLVGLGVNELSAVPSVIPEIKAKLRRWRLEDCRALAERALAAESAATVRAIARDAGASR